MPNTDSIANAFIGKGLTFPIILQNGRPVISGGKELIEASLRDNLSWVLGTKFFLGEYGGKIEYLLQEPDNGASAALLRYYTEGVIRQWEPRVTNVVAKVLSRSQGVMQIKLFYQITNTKITGSFIFPYYSQLIY